MTTQSEALDRLREVRADSRRWSHLRQPHEALSYPWAASGDRALWNLLNALDDVLATHVTITADDGTVLPMPDGLTVTRYAARMYGLDHGPLDHDSLVSIAGQVEHDRAHGRDPYGVRST